MSREFLDGHVGTFQQIGAVAEELVIGTDVAAPEVSEPPSVPRKRGRPSTYDEETAEDIIDLVQQGYTFERIYAEYKDELPTPKTITRWRRNNEAFDAAIRRAQLAAADSDLDAIVDIADEDGDAYKRIDARKYRRSERLAFVQQKALPGDSARVIDGELIPPGTPLKDVIGNRVYPPPILVKAS